VPEGGTVVLDGFFPQTLSLVNPPEIVMGETIAFVPGGAGCLFQPGDGLIDSSLLDQIDPDVVIRVAEIRVDLNGPVAFLAPSSHLIAFPHPTFIPPGIHIV